MIDLEEMEKVADYGPVAYYLDGDKVHAYFKGEEAFVGTTTLEAWSKPDVRKCFLEMTLEKYLGQYTRVDKK